MYDKMVKKLQSGVNMTINQAFSIRVRAILKEKKMTQYRLEQATGLYHSTMTSILGGKNEGFEF